MLRLAPLLLLIGAACSAGGPEPAVDRTQGTVINQTEASLIWLALDAEVATRTDPASEIAITDDNRNTILAPGASSHLLIEAYREGEDFVLFLYRVEGDRATFATVQPVSARAFARSTTVTIDRL